MRPSPRAHASKQCKRDVRQRTQTAVKEYTLSAIRKRARDSLWKIIIIINTASRHASGLRNQASSTEKGPLRRVLLFARRGEQTKLLFLFQMINEQPLSRHNTPREKRITVWPAGPLVHRPHECNAKRVLSAVRFCAAPSDVGYWRKSSLSVFVVSNPSRFNAGFLGRKQTTRNTQPASTI